MDDVLPDDNMENGRQPFEFRQLPVSEGLQEENWKAVEAAIRQLEHTPLQPVRRTLAWRKVLVAAACLLTIAFGIRYVSTRKADPQYTIIGTGYGEIKHILLPDSSVVVLNANSSMRIPQQWADADGRQVWLEGEAYFQVQKKTPEMQKFVVHTQQVDVEVLGTRFNVNTRRKRSIVSLEEGKVRLAVNGGGSSVLEKKEPVILRPGQVAVVDEARKTTMNDDKDVATRSGWSRHEFHFDNTSLGEIARLIEDTYGYSMEVEQPEMFKVAISGDLRVSSVQELVKVLELPLGYNLRIKDKTIYVTAR